MLFQLDPRVAKLLAAIVLPWAIAVPATLPGQTDTASPLMARGVVFHDVNGDQRLDNGDRRLAGMRLSNGRDIAMTGDQGQYEIPLDDDSILFLVKPRGYRTRLAANNLPLFYYIHKPAGSPRLQFPGVAPTGPLPASIDFPLYSRDEPETFQVILFGDTQSRDATEIGYMNRTTIHELIGSSAAFGVTLGDILFDDLSLYDYHNQSVAMIGVPWHNVLGNHDLNLDTVERRFANETFEGNFGPSYYSFDHGPVHFLVLDNIDWHLPPGEARPRYKGAFGDRQLEFVRNDLAKIPDDQFVVLFMHIPLPNCEDARALYRLIEKRPLCFSVSAHRHIHEHRFLGEADGWMGETPHHHVVNVTVCGSWWSGRKNADGIPHGMMADGAPRGYSIVTFDEGNYKLDFKASGMPADEQIRIMTPDEITSGNSSSAVIFVNVFNGSSRSTVRYRVDGSETWLEMAPLESVDPEYLARYWGEQMIVPSIKPKLSRPAVSAHLWSSLLPDLSPGVHLLEVRTTDMHGREFGGHRLIRVIADR